MTLKQLLNNFVKETNERDGAKLFIQLIESLENPQNDYNGYERDVRNIEKVVVSECSKEIVHFTIHRKNGSKCFVETCI